MIEAATNEPHVITFSTLFLRLAHDCLIEFEDYVFIFPQILLTQKL